MSRTRTVLGLAAALCLPLSMAGCLDYREQLLLRPDGAGKLTVDFVVNLGLMNEIALAFGDKPDPDARKGPTREEIMQGLKVEGIKVEELTVQHKADKSKVHLELKFKSLDKLTQIEGFGDDRKVEFFDNGDGKVRVVYSFDTRDVIPLEELGEEPADGAELDPIEKKILEITAKARAQLKFKGRVELPGEILKSNGKTDSKKPPSPNARVWAIDRKSDPRKHAQLGRGKIVMKMLVERSAVPWVKELLPAPKAGQEGTSDGGKKPRGPAGPPGIPRRGLGD